MCTVRNTASNDGEGGGAVGVEVVWGWCEGSVESVCGRCAGGVRAVCGWYKRLESSHIIH